MADASPLVSPETQEVVRKKISLEDMSKEDLIKQVKKQIILLQKTKTKCDDLNKVIAELEQNKEKDNLALELLKEQERLLEETMSKNEDLRNELSSSNELCSTHQKEKNSLQEKHECLNMKMETLSDTCKILQEEVTALHQQKHALSSEVKILTEENNASVNSLNDQLNIAQKQIDEMQHQLGQKDHQEQELIKQLQECNSMQEEYSIQIETLRSDYEELKGKWVDSESECQSLKIRIETFESSEMEAVQCEQLQIRLQEVLLELEGTKIKIGELVTENRELVSVNEESKTKMQMLVDELETLTCKYSKMKLIVEECNEQYEADVVRTELKQCQNRCNEIESLLEEEKKTVKEMQEQMQQSGGNVQMDKEINSNWLSEREEYKQVIERLNSDMKKMLSDVDTNMQQWALEKSNLLKDLEEMKLTKEECIEKILQTKAELEAQRIQWKEEKELLLKDFGSVKEWEEESHQKLEQIQDVRITLLEQLTEATRTIKRLEQDLLKTGDQKQDAVEELLQVKDLQKFLEDEAKALREECEKTKIEIKRLEADLENDFLHIRNLEKELRDAEERENASNKEVEVLHSHVICMEEALQVAEIKLERNTNALEKELKCLKKKHDDVENEYQNAVSKVLELQRESKAFICKQEELQVENVALKDRLDELSSVIWHQVPELIMKEWEEEKCSLEEQLNKQNNTIEVMNSELRELRETVLILRGNVEDLVEIKPATDNKRTDVCPESVDSKVCLLGETFDCSNGITPLVKCKPYNAVEELQKVNEDLRTDLEQLTEKSEELQEVVETKSQMMEKMLIEMNNLLQQIDDLNSVIGEKEQDLDSLSNKFNAQTDCLKSLEIALNKKNEMLNSITSEHDEKASEDLEKSVCKLTESNEVLLSEINHIKLERDELQEQLAALNCKNKHIGKQELDNFQQQVEFTNQEQTGVVTNELLQEQVDVHATDFAVISDENIDISVVIALKATIVDLKEEVQRLQQQLELKEGSLHVTTEEVRKPELHEELEQKLKIAEEKMAKFKVLALRGKKEAAEMKRERDNLAKQNEDISLNSRQHLSNFQSLQSEYDKLQDEYESSKDNHNKKCQEITLHVSEINNLKEQMQNIMCENTKLQSNFDSMCIEKKAAKQGQSDAESKVIVLRSEKEGEQKKVELVKAESAKLSQKVKSLEEELVQEKEQHRLTTQKLEHKLQEAKQQSVLNLEIADYEHSISELNKNLTTKDVEISALQDEISRQAERISNLIEQIGYLESQHDVEEERVKSLKIALTKVKEENNELKEQEGKLENQLASTKYELESITAAKEDLQVQLSESSGEVSKLQESLRNAKESYERATKSLETRLKNLEEELVQRTTELNSTRQEFEGYKVRVHSVLKQKQQPVVVNASEQEEKQRLKRSFEQCQVKLQQMSDSIQTKNIEMETLQQEHDRLLSRHTQLVSDLQLKDESWISKMEHLKKEHGHHQSVWEMQKQHLEHELKTREENYNKEILNKELLHKVEINDLSSKLCDKEKELAHSQRETNLASFHSPHEDVPFDILTQERQEGEGSECADLLPQYKTSFVPAMPSSGCTPLEQLLQNSSDAENNETFHQDNESLTASLVAASKKLDHITELLNESEASNMRLSEQVRILKEEIRRLERNKEREEHSSNLEYLKNIILKFLLLQGSSERQRLLPVLSTILRLSPEEQAEIQATTIGHHFFKLIFLKCFYVSYFNALLVITHLLNIITVKCYSKHRLSKIFFNNKRLLFVSTKIMQCT